MLSRLQKLLLTTTALVPLGLAPAAANPLGAQVVGGSASVQGQGTANVSVTQSTDKAIINWNTFNIGANEATRFVQPSSSAIALNRVTGGLGPSQIFGNLSANGRIFVVNRDGILVGPGAKIDAAGFLATTHDIANADFMAGRYNFSIPGRPDASVVNQGTITAQSGGFAALVAPGVRNSGTITARLGKIALASGNGFTLDFYGDKLITLGVNDSIATVVKDVATGQPLKALVSNEGKLKANGGRVELTAVAARQVVDSIINNTGVIEANAIGNHNGMIVLSAATAKSKPAGAPTQTVKVSGTLSAVGKNVGETGGKIQITGEAIEVIGATIDASGVAGGGAVLIGGDVGGGNPSPAVASIARAQLQPYAVPTASTVTVDAATTINASAKDTGDGGKVVVWADQVTTFDGTILARGGATFGNGGFVETSGRQQLAFNGTVDTGAPNGTSGTLLLDPLNVTIATNAGTGVITVAALQNSLASGNLVVTTGSTGSEAGNITIAAAVNWSSTNTLTLNADNNIAINAAVTGNNGGLTLKAGGTIGATAAVSVGTFTLQNGSWNQVATNLAGFSANDFRITGGSFLRALGGNGTNGSPYQIADIYGVQGVGSAALLDKNFVLAININASGTVNWNNGAGFMPIGTFGGTFDGQNHTFDGLRSATGGLFSQIGTNGIVRNLTLSNVAVNATVLAPVGALAGTNSGTISNVSISGGSVSSSAVPSFVGGLVGQNFGTITLSSANVAVTGGTGGVLGGLVGWNANGGVITRSYATGGVTGGSNADLGGVAGWNDGTISMSFANGSVVAGGGADLGGLVGSNFYDGSIRDSFATGAVTGGRSNGASLGALVGSNLGSITTSFASGKVTGNPNTSAGGLVGSNFQGTIANSYWDTQSTGQSGSAGGTGLTTTQLIAALPSGFDPAAWTIIPGVSYPYLRWQPAATIPIPLFIPPALVPITVTADNLSIVYGTADPMLTYHITSGSLSGSAAFSGALTRVSGQNVGTYSITLGTLSLPSMYTLTYVGGTLRITPASLTITANSTSRQAGAANPPFTASYSGFVAGDGPSVVSGLTLLTPATTSSPAGTYSIVPGGASALNYRISYVNGILTVTSAPTPTPTPTPTPAPTPTPTPSPVVFYVQSGAGTILSLNQISGHTYPVGTFFIQSGTGVQFTPEQLGGFTAALPSTPIVAPAPVPTPTPTPIVTPTTTTTPTVTPTANFETLNGQNIYVPPPNIQFGIQGSSGPQVNMNDLAIGPVLAGTQGNEVPLHTVEVNLSQAYSWVFDPFGNIVGMVGGALFEFFGVVPPSTDSSTPGQYPIIAPHIPGAWELLTRPMVEGPAADKKNTGSPP